MSIIIWILAINRAVKLMGMLIQLFPVEFKFYLMFLLSKSTSRKWVQRKEKTKISEQAEMLKLLIDFIHLDYLLLLWENAINIVWRMSLWENSTQLQRQEVISSMLKEKDLFLRCQREWQFKEILQIIERWVLRGRSQDIKG